VTSSHSSQHQATRWPVRGPARVLLLLDRPTLVELVKLTLNHGVHTLRAVATAAQVKVALDEWQPHLVVLDMDLDGTQIVALLPARAATSGHLPVIGLTRRGDLRTKLAAFEAGVDDILTVPFGPEELLPRVIAVLRRSYSDAVTFTPVIKIGALEIDILNRTVRAGTSKLYLTSLEQSLLYLLAANAGRVVTREEILDTLWGWTTWLRVTWWTARSVADGRDSRTTGGSRASSPQCRNAAIASCRRGPSAEGPPRFPDEYGRRLRRLKVGGGWHPARVPRAGVSVLGHHPPCLGIRIGVQGHSVMTA
jgi:DNA-binding response OmpR family regulator